MFYVTVRDAGKVGFLLGPLATKAEAEARVEDVRGMATELNSWAAFYAFGTSRWKGAADAAPQGSMNKIGGLA